MKKRPIRISNPPKRSNGDLRLFRYLIDRTNDAIFVIDPETGCFLDVNAKACSNLGYERKELLKMCVPDVETLVPNLSSWKSRVAEVKKTGAAVRKGRQKRKDGTTFPVEVNSTYISHENKDYFVAVARDITERKKSEEDLRNAVKRVEEEKARNELILKSAGEGIYGVDFNGNTTFINPAAAKMIGWEVEEIIGRRQHDVLHHSRPDGSAYPVDECPIYAAFKDGSVHHVTDEVFWKKNGTSFPVDYTSTPIIEDGKLVGAVVIFSDISERKKAEQRLKESESRLKEAQRIAYTGLMKFIEYSTWSRRNLVPYMRPF
jgi:PAS domain S-box-containing protein